MSRLSRTFADLSTRGEKALILYVTAGDPSLDDLPGILEALVEGGADVIEVGLPFSDPIADGPVIQAASQRALERGVTTSQVFRALERRPDVPLVLMGYMNPILRRGFDVFAREAVGAGADGVIVCDLTPDEAGSWVTAAHAVGLDTVFLTAPTSTPDRLALVCENATGFVYAVSRTGVTGSSDSGWDEAEDLVGRIRSRTGSPVCVGFGISTPDDVRAVCAFADGAIVGSWLVGLLAKEWDGGRGRDKVVEAVRRLKDATC
ncbi:MAG: tryptophan synthase subunit alpha [Armatimonadetes bacterium]|nr:tryptophan synthase subunit alpha [Armatimonadota bacterium]